MISYRGGNKVAVIAGVLALIVAFALASPSPGRAEPITPQEADSDMAAALNVTDGFWRKHWSEYFSGSYSSPKVVGLYDSRKTPMPCASWGNIPTSNNAWYCSTTDSVGFDLDFMEDVYSLGDSFIYLVVAHEWGHAIQARLNSTLQFQAKELQADCFAGAVLYGAAKDGTLQWEAGDAQEIANSLTAVADKYPWTKVSDHGDAGQRIANFNVGKGGPKACLPH